MRPSLDSTMLKVARTLAMRGTCMKKQVGCVAINNKGHIISSGYNGQARGKVHCTVEAPCEAYTDQTQSCRAIHAEMNMLMRCSDIDDIETVYITEKPCEKCTLSIQNTACKRIVFYGYVDSLIEWNIKDEEPLI